MHDNKILSMFTGHDTMILSIEPNCKYPIFVSLSKDNIARVWDYDKVDAVALFSECQASCFDNTGEVLACVHNPKDLPKKMDVKHVYLYNVKEEGYDKPFSVLQAELDRNIHINTIKFSYDGKQVLLSDEHCGIYIMDAFEGGITTCTKLRTLDEPDERIMADFTPNSNYVLASYSNKVMLWNWNTDKMTHYPQIHVKDVRGLKFSTEHLFFASACQNLVLWCPDLDQLIHSDDN